MKRRKISIRAIKKLCKEHDLTGMLGWGDIRDTQWFLPPGYKSGKDNSPRYCVSETQLRMLFAMRFNPLDFNRDYVKEFINREKLTRCK